MLSSRSSPRFAESICAWTTPSCDSASWASSSKTKNDAVHERVTRVTAERSFLRIDQRSERDVGMGSSIIGRAGFDKPQKVRPAGIIAGCPRGPPDHLPERVSSLDHCNDGHTAIG